MLGIIVCVDVSPVTIDISDNISVCTKVKDSVVVIIGVEVDTPGE